MTNIPFKIVTDVPIVRALVGRNALLSPLSRAIYALATAAPIGASFFVPESECTDIHALSGRGYQLAGKGWASIRAVEGGYRMWKFAEPNMTERQRRYTSQGVNR